MSRTWAVVKREFGENVRTKAFILGTIFGPVLMIALIVLPVLFMSGQSESDIVVVDATGAGIGSQVAAQLEAIGEAAAEEEDDVDPFTVELLALDAGADVETLREDLRTRAAADSIDGYLLLPEGVITGEEGAEYEGRNATNFGEMRDIRNAVTQAVRERRLSDAGIAATELASALAPVPLTTRKVGAEGTTGPPEFLIFLSQALAFVIYFMIILYGMAVSRGVLEEKRDRIVEVVISSVRPGQLMLGKVLGIGGAGLVQMLVWVGFAALVLTFGEGIAASFGAELPDIPAIPGAIAALLPVYFLGGFFLYACLFAAGGATVTTDQEAQQLQFPILTPLMIGFFMMFAALNDADGGVALWGSIIPFTSPMIMPVRAALTDIPPVQMIASILLLFGTGFLVLWAGAKIYRIGILSTGQRASLRDIWKWVRTA